MCPLLANGMGVVEDATTVDGTAVENIGRELMNISNSERGSGGRTQSNSEAVDSWKLGSWRTMGTASGVSMEEARAVCGHHLQSRWWTGT